MFLASVGLFSKGMLFYVGEMLFVPERPLLMPRMQALPPESLTVPELRRRIRRYNSGYRLWGIVLLGLAVLFWLLTVATLAAVAAFFREGPWLLPDRVGIVTIVAGCFLSAVLFRANRAVFFRRNRVFDAPALRGPVYWEALPLSAGRLVFGILVAAPLLTGLAVSVFRQRLSARPARLETACFVYNYLTATDSWIAYPPFESQRRAIQLLEALELVRVSRRFGRLQVKTLKKVVRQRKED